MIRKLLCVLFGHDWHAVRMFAFDDRYYEWCLRGRHTR